jgi:hypothetical protein
MSEQTLIGRRRLLAGAALGAATLGMPRAAEAASGRKEYSLIPER